VDDIWENQMERRKKIYIVEDIWISALFVIVKPGYSSSHIVFVELLLKFV